MLMKERHKTERKDHSEKDSSTGNIYTVIHSRSKGWLVGKCVNEIGLLRKGTFYIFFHHDRV